HYLVACDIKNGNGIRARIGVNDTEYSRFNGNYIERSDKFETSYVTVTVDESYEIFRVSLLLTTSTSDQYAYFDGLRIYEISIQEKDYIDSLPVEDAQAYIASNYP